MEDFEIKDTGKQVTIKLNKSGFDQDFLNALQNRLKLESIVKRASFDKSFFESLQEDRSLIWQESRAEYKKSGEKGNS